MRFHKILVGMGALMLCVMLSSCSKDIRPGTYDATEVGKIKKVVSGVVVSKRSVNIQNRNADNTPVDGPKVADASTMDNAGGHSRGFEYVIKLNSGAIISVVQVEELELKAKQHVLVIYGQNTRVVPDDGSDD